MQAPYDGRTVFISNALQQHSPMMDTHGTFKRLVDISVSVAVSSDLEPSSEERISHNPRVST